MKNTVKCFYCALLFLFVVSCTFDYGEGDSSSNDLPDLIMKNVVYVRVRSGNPQARFMADRAERYDNQGIMVLLNLTFEQYGERGDEINAFGRAGFASVDIETNDIFMDNGVIIEVESEDIIIKTNQLEWKDEERLLFTGENDEVNILQPNGTSFIGIGLTVNARRRTWEFLGSVSGIYIYDDDEDKDEDETEQIIYEPPIEDKEPDWIIDRSDVTEFIWEELK